ncbi:B3 domain-containing protein family [Quillaja saponaria]|uniref:B3 domain-containing protein family n=1 Tax=Quillaja saponaria TaxID=32244 RepID=A0AAD7LT04_QUISA|nr:B3 domain-containing protein family [Quillaja saponaria]
MDENHNNRKRYKAEIFNIETSHEEVWLRRPEATPPPPPTLDEQSLVKASHEIVWLRRTEATSPPPPTLDEEQRILEPPPSPDLPLEFRNRIQELDGCEVQFLIQKKLFKSDLTKTNDRFSIPINQIGREFLTDHEKIELDRRVGARGDYKGRLPGINVLVLDPYLRKYQLKLKKWDMKKSSVYNLTHKWYELTWEANLNVDDELQLWSFRIDGQLCFALVKVKSQASSIPLDV